MEPGGLTKLEIYRRAEVEWSEVLPELDLGLLARHVDLQRTTSAIIRAFRAALGEP